MKKIFIGCVATEAGFAQLKNNYLTGPKRWFGELNVGDYALVSGENTIIDKILEVESIEEFQESGEEYKKYNFKVIKRIEPLRSNIILSNKYFVLDLVVLNKAQNPSFTSRFFELKINKKYGNFDIEKVNFEDTYRQFWIITQETMKENFRQGDILIVVDNRDKGYMIKDVFEYDGEIFETFDLFSISDSINLQNYGLLKAYEESKAYQELNDKKYSKKANLLGRIIENLDNNLAYKHPIDSNISEFYQNALCIKSESKKTNNVEILKEKDYRLEYKIESNLSFGDFCKEKGYYYSNDTIRRFITSLKTKRFLLITGISGTGKTKIAELWIKYLNCSNNQSIKISVGSNWNDNKKLLGFKNILFDDGKSYEETDLVKLIKDANREENKNKEYIVILDEMNLSYVERYFADFLSALESFDKEIMLPNGEKIYWSENIKVIGTVNVDETTYMFSPKVLDRANVIEMNGKLPSEYIESIKNSKEKIYRNIKNEFWFAEYIEIMDKIYYAMKKNFAYRTIDEVTKYIKINLELDNQDENNWKKYLDEQIIQKIMPKLHGNRAVVEPILNDLENIIKEDDNYILTMNKIEQMKNDLLNGYVSFIGN